MTQKTSTRKASRQPADVFDRVRTVGLTLPDVEATIKYDGSPVLKVGGCFMAGLATHHSAEPATLVVRVAPEEQACLMEDAPDTYYTTDYYQHHPVALVRLARLTQDALRDVLSASWRLTLAKARKRPDSLSSSPSVIVEDSGHRYDSFGFEIGVGRTAGLVRGNDRIRPVGRRRG